MCNWFHKGLDLRNRYATGLCIGGCLIDFVSDELDKPISECHEFIEAAGGALANVAVGLSTKPEELERRRIRYGERILFKTRKSLSGWNTESFIEDFVFISK